MEDWFDKISAKCHRAVEVNKEVGWWQYIERTSVEKYTEVTHFVYELLQNADDQNATKAGFRLYEDRLIFWHCGDPFKREDVEAITDLGNSQKPQQENKIGKFGIGFKSVFAMTDRVEIYTTLDREPFAFAIENIVVPVRIAYGGQHQPEETRFVFPFKSGNAERLYGLIAAKLTSLGAETLLFLNHLTDVEWETETEQGFYFLQVGHTRTGKVALCDERGRKGEPSEFLEYNYLVCSRKVQLPGIDTSLSVSLAFRLQDDVIIPDPGQPKLNVFFETEEETHLKFRLHGPFRLNESRANIKKDDPATTTLIAECAVLLAETLPWLRDKGLLTTQFLDCLPIRADEFRGSLFRPLYDAVCNALKTQGLIPTENGTFVTLACARIPDSADLRLLLAGGLLQQIYHQSKPVCWLPEEVTERRMPDLWKYLRTVIGVEELDAEGFARLVNEPFLQQQTDEWVSQFYIFLCDRSSLWRRKDWRQAGILRSKPILRLENGCHVLPYQEDGITPNAYLPPENETWLPIVKRSIASDEEAHRFLLDLGLQVPDVIAEVIENVLPLYRSSNVKATREDNVTHIALIAQAIENVSSERRESLRQALREAIFVYAERADDRSKHYWVRPSRVYKCNQETQEWFAGNPEVYFVSESVAEQSVWPVIARFLQVADSVTVEARPPNTDGHVVIVERRGNYERGKHRFDPDATVPGIDYALETITEAKASILWHLLLTNASALSGFVESSHYKSYLGATQDWKRSTLAELCRETAWISARGDFHKPCDVELSELSANWETNTDKAKSVSYILGFKQIVMSEIEILADKEDIPTDDMKEMFAAYKRNPDAMRRFAAQPLQELHIYDLTTGGPSNPEHYRERLAQEAEEAPKKTYAIRNRRVRISSNDDKEIATGQLRLWYTRDENLLCQICRNAMPFNRLDGDSYFETVEFIRDRTHENPYCYLALCPLCAAKYQYANNTTRNMTTFDTLRQEIEESESKEIAITLAGQPHTIQFDGRHWIGLRHALGFDEAGL